MKNLLIGDITTPIITSNTSAGTQKKLLSRYLDDNGDGTGSKNANGNYSGAEEIFYCQPAAGEVFRISRMVVMIEDGSGFRAERYGSINGALGNGITIRSADNSSSGVIVDFTDGTPIKTNAQWGRLLL